MTTDVQRLLEAAPQLSVGILTADLLRLGAELEALFQAGIRIAHVDVMDGVYCPPLTAGVPLVKAVPEQLVKDVHLMIDEPVGKVEAYIEAGAGILTFHVEATRHPHRVLQSMADCGVVRGAALNPGTPVSVLEPLIDDLELILLLAVNPGWSGQAFIPSTERRIDQARNLIGDRDVALSVDGGITRSNVARVASLGPDIIVTGSAVFDGVQAFANAQTMQSAVVGARRASRSTLPDRTESASF